MFERRKFLLQAVASFVLLLLIVVYAGRLLARFPFLTWDLSGRAASTISPRTRAFLAEAKPLLVDFFVTGRERMPSALKGVEARVRSMLEGMSEAAPGVFDFRVIDPELGGADAAAYASNLGAAPFSVRQVSRDEESERKIWSALVVRYGNHRRVLVPTVTEETLVYLERLIVDHLKALEKPPRPVFGVAGTAPSTEMRAFLKSLGTVEELDLSKDASIPPSVDLLFWLDPGLVSPALSREFRRFVDSGRSAVIAGSGYEVEFVDRGAGKTAFRARAVPEGAMRLLEPFGLNLVSDLLMDARFTGIVWKPKGGAQRLVQAPFHVQIPPAQIDLRDFKSQSTGFLHFPAASSIEIDTTKAAKAGFRARILASSSDASRVMPLPDGVFGLDRVAGGVRVANQPLAVDLSPADALKGRVLVLGSSGPLRDGLLAQPSFSHRPFLVNLVRTLVNSDRLVMTRLERPGPPPLPKLAPGRKALWRFLAIFLVPGVLLAAAAVLMWRSVETKALPAPDPYFAKGAAAAAAGLAVCVWLWRPGGALGWDLSEDRVNSPAPAARERVSAAGGSRLSARLFISEKALLPVTMKSLRSDLAARLLALGLRAKVVHPELLPASERKALESKGLAPFVVKTVVKDEEVEHTVWSGLLLEDGARAEAIPELRPRNLGHLDFLVAAAADRLKTGKRPHAAIHSDLPRMSPAEAFHYYQDRQMTAPAGTDPYGEMKTLLRNYGYRTTYVNPKDPSLPKDIDVLIWMQPRFRAAKMMELLSRHLSRGGKAVVAMQHYNIQQRQYRGRGFDTVYWPQPQYQDLDPYIELLGVHQEKEILMDKTRSQLDLDFQIHRTTDREYDAQRVALPFLIRAVGSNFNKGSVITARLSDQLFMWGNRFVSDPELLKKTGLAAVPLITTSDRAWRFKWKGGWLPQEVFEPPAYLPGKQTLAMLLRGSFPPAVSKADAKGNTVMSLAPAPKDAGPGELILIGSSHMFRNGFLYESGFRHDQFLLNAAAAMAHDPEMARLQARERTIRGFAFVDPREKLFYRLLATAGGALLILLYGLRRWALRARPLRSAA